jgi:hypothetical protein
MDFQDKQDIKIPICFIRSILYIHVDDFMGAGRRAGDGELDSLTWAWGR